MKQRIRRGIVVEIPEEWEGQVCYEQTQKKRREEAALKRKRRRKRLRDEAEWLRRMADLEDEGGGFPAETGVLVQRIEEKE